MEYRNTTKNMRQIGDELGRRLFARRQSPAGRETGLRIIIQLIDAASDEHVWQDTYDRELTAENIFEIQSEMATSIATELHQTLSPEMTAKLNERPTQNTRAYDFYLSGDVYLKRSASWMWRNNNTREQSRKIRKFALAWAALSRAHTRYVLEWLSTELTGNISIRQEMPPRLPL